MRKQIERLLTLAESLTPSGEIGDGQVAEFHAAAAALRGVLDGTVAYQMRTRDTGGYCGWVLVSSRYTGASLSLALQNGISVVAIDA